MKRLTAAAMIAGALLLAALYWPHSRQAAPGVAGPQAAAPAVQAPDLTPKAASTTNEVLRATRQEISSHPIPLARLVPRPALPEPVAITAFSNWTAAFLAGDPAAHPARGEALACQRREALRALIETQPEQALALAAPWHWRSALPPNITRHFEQQVDGRGALNVAVADGGSRGGTVVFREAVINGARYEAFVYGRRLRQVSQQDLPLHGIAIGDKLALDADPVRLLEPGEAEALAQARQRLLPKMCAVCAQIAPGGQGLLAGDIGGEWACFCGAGHASLAKDYLIAVETAKGISLGDTRWTHGVKTLLYMRVNFPDDLTEPISESEAYQVMNEVNDFYTEDSYDRTALDAIVTPLLTLPRTKAWYTTSGPGGLLSDARDLARRSGYDTSNFDLDIVAFTTVPQYDFGGLGFVHGKGTWLQSMGAGVTAHELGHNYGVLHGNYWITTNYSMIGPGTNVEYGNIFDTMGAAAAGPNQFGTPFKSILGWLPDSAIATAATNGLYRIYPFDVPQRVDGRTYAARVRKDFDRDYWLEFRQLFTWNPWLQNGLLLNWGPCLQSDGGTALLDTTPGTPTGSGSREDAAVVIGRTFSDTAAGVHITPLERGATGTNAWIDVQVNLGGFPGNRLPTLRVEVDPTNAAPGTLVRFHAVAADPDGDALAYAWTFDDLSFSTNNLSWTWRTWNDSGEKVVRCVVSDMKGGVATANAVVTVGSPTAFRISGEVRDLAGAPLQGVRIDHPGMPAYTDSEGRYVITDATGDTDLQAFQYGYYITNAGWANPLSVTSNLPRVDFVAVPMPTVRLEASTNAMPENGGGVNIVTLTRTGDTNADMTVTVILSGTARAGGDYTITPELAAGSNTVVIPAGEYSTVMTVRTVNDTLVEGTETIALTLVEDDTFALAQFSEVVISILDDDQPARPAVSVSAPAPTIPENGQDHGVFALARTGGVQGDLPVYYAMSGTATAGADYTTLPGVAVIPAGSSSVQLALQPIDDKLVEPNETAVLTILPNANYSVSGGPATIEITDDDQLTVSVFPTDDSAAEPGISGRFTLKRDGDLTSGLLVNFTVGGTATPDLDYYPLSSPAIIPPGAASVDVYLTPKDDLLVEGDETVTLTLTNGPGYDVGTPANATLVIRDNEKVPVSIDTIDGFASEPGEDTAKFRISRGGLTSGDLTVFLTISGTALNGIDYAPIDNAVVIPNGASSVTIEVIPYDDLHIEPTETIIVAIDAGTNYLAGSGGQVRISLADDDANSVPAAGFCAAASSAWESDSPGICVGLSYTSSAPVTVDYKVIGGTASPTDYSLPAPPLTFEPGQSAVTLPLTINNNSTAQPNRTIRLVLYNPIGATLDGIKIHTYTILDDDPNTVSVAATQSAASETGPVPGNFRISRTGSTASNLTVNFEITGTASAPGDYAPLGTSAVIPTGAAFVDLPVLVVDDQTVEFDQTVRVTLTSAPGATLVAPNSATVTISDNDANTLPVVSVTATNRPYAVEGGDGGELAFTRSATNGSLVVRVVYSGTAINGTDCVRLPDTVTFPDGQSTVTVPVSAIDDTLVEGEETLVAAIVSQDSYRVAYPSSAIVTIQDNDQRVRIDASDFVASEPGLDTGEFTFSRFGTTNTDLRVYFTIGGTATLGVDYAAFTNSVVIPAGSLSVALPVLPLDDTLVEGAETVRLTLLTNSLYVLGESTNSTVTIYDDEPMLWISAVVSNVVEGSRDPGVFRLSREGDPRYDFTARLVVGGSAGFGIDYPVFQTNVYFTCGVVSIDLLVFPTNELVIEGLETVTVAVVPDSAYTLLAPSNAVITIEDAATNIAPAVTITSPTVPTVFLLGTNVNMILETTVADDDTNAPLTLVWSKVSGPDTLSFGATNLANSTVSFTNIGVYVLRLTADDGVLTNYAEVTAVVGAVDLLTTNLLHWTLDDGAGTNVLDSSGWGRAGVLAGSAAWTTNGVLGGALQLGNPGGWAAEASPTGVLNGLPEFTLSLWVNAAATNNDRGIFTANDNTTNTTLALSTRTLASCGNHTNVVELSLATDTGSIRRVSANNAITNGWQHLALSWSNGLAPALFINGQLDQPLFRMAALAGTLTNCPQFIVGKGPSDFAAGWQGLIDDVRVFPQALGAREIGALASLPPANYGAVVEVGSNMVAQATIAATLEGRVTDDGKPNPPGATTNTWLMVSGPAEVVFSNTNALTNTVVFPLAGDYVLRLIGDDGQVKVYDDLPVTVIEPTRIDVYASDAEAAELGPDTGTFTFTRAGDTGVDLTVYLAMSGIASNGMDFPALPYSITFSNGIDTLDLVVTPFLDHRTEGDETLIYTIVSNASYSIGSGEATVTIHDSPYGAWTVGHFTLEELTDPRLSSEGADFDHDGLVNFAEYAANRDPKALETNAPVVTALELNPADNLYHITVTYPRRLSPTDTGYEVRVSTDLVTWQIGTNYVEEIQVTDDGNNLTETVKARLKAPWTNSVPQFIDVQVWLRATGP